MIKKLRFILPLFVVLLSGYIQQNRDGYYESTFLTAIKDFEGSVFSDSTGLPVFQGFSVQSLPSNSDNGNVKNHATAIEEKNEELVAFKKYLEFGDEFYTYSSAVTFVANHFFIAERPFFFRKIYHSPSYKALYILLKVFRI